MKTKTDSAPSPQTVREGLGKSIAQLAVANDLSEKTVRDFERGILTPTFRTTVKLKSAYGQDGAWVESWCRETSK